MKWLSADEKLWAKFKTLEDVQRLHISGGWAFRLPMPGYSDPVDVVDKDTRLRFFG